MPLAKLIARLPLAPRFINSGWNLTFDVLPLYWDAKAFWVSCATGMLWPYLAAGFDYNFAISWLM